MTSWNDIRHEIEKKAVLKAPAAASAESFWADFQAHARLTVQEKPAASNRVLWASVAFAGSLALLALAAIPFLWAPNSLAGDIQITSLEVDAPHSASMILNVVSENGKEKGAIVWVSGLEESHEQSP